MNRLQLADEFLKAMYMLKKTRPQKRINEAIHGEVLTLRFIHVHGGNVLPSEISGEINVSTARIAASLNRLEKKGLITRQIDTSDRRRILVNLTDEGMALAARREQELLDDTVKIIGLLGEDDAREYLRITNRLLEIMQNHTRWSDPDFKPAE